MTLHLHLELNRRVRAWREEDLLRAMGYRHASPKARAHLRHVLEDAEFGLRRGFYDLRHHSRSFVERLCTVLGIPAAGVRRELDSIQQQLLEEVRAYPGWIFVETGFRRADRPNTPLFALALLEAHRRLAIPGSVRCQPFAAQLAYVQTLVREHFRNANGELPLWGPIQCYRFFHADGQSLDLAPDGTILEAQTDAVAQEPASLRVGGRPLALTPDAEAEEA